MRVRRTIAAILAAVLTYGVFFGIAAPSFAAVAPVNLTVVNYDSGVLDVKWTPPAGAKAVKVNWYTSDDPVNPKRIVSTTTLDKASVTGLESDYIFEIRVRFYDSTALDGGGNPTGVLIGEGLLYYLPKITFYADSITQAPDPITGGGLDSGKNPKLNLKWKIPKIRSASLSFQLINHVNAGSLDMIKQMQDDLNSVYKDGRAIKVLNFRINLSPDLSSLNGGASSITIIQKPSDGSYTANLPGSTAADVKIGADEFASFNLWGRSDASSQVPAIERTDNTKSNYDPYGLAFDELYPGSVYYMNIKPIFDATPIFVSNMTVGNPSDNNGSMLSGQTSYASTPIRFQLTKDGLNNIYVKTFRINQGSLDLPRLYYEVQSSDDPSIQGDWPVKATMVDSNFSGGYAITIIQGVDPNSNYYYRIVVKSDSPTDRLESIKMLYTLKDDTNRPPLPTNVLVTNKVLEPGPVTIQDPADATKTITFDVKSTTITITWDKPLGWDDNTLNKANLYFHFLLSTSQSDMNTPIDMYADGTSGNTPVRQYLGQYTPMFRLVRYIRADDLKSAGGEIEEVGNKLSLTINGIKDLFTWDTNSTTGGNIPNNGYPKFLLSNTVYYLQMYSSTAADAGLPYSDSMSDKSLITSFTTLSSMGLDVPLPMSFALDENGKDQNGINYVDLTFDKVTNLDWGNYFDSYDTTLYDYKIYYDLWASPRSDTATFIPIGSTEDLPANCDVGFTGASDPTSTTITARISKFLPAHANIFNLFGSNLLPNTTYYFRVGTRLKRTLKAAPNTVTNKPSGLTAILPVTTIPISVNPPDDSQRKPLAPTDFAIAEKADGNLDLSGSSVTFTWKRQEDDVVYQLIRTRLKVNPTDGLNTYQADPEYTSFINIYDTISDGKTNSLVYLDPVKGTTIKPNDPFRYDAATKTCTFTVNQGMFPNKLYYFSLKAVRVTRDQNGDFTPIPSESSWVSIPVTTYLIDQPSMLEVVNSAELGFFWTDAAPGMIAEDYSIYVKGPGDSDFKLMTRSQSTVTKDGQTYYGRVLGLKNNSTYDVRVFKGNGASGTPIYENPGMKTRDGFHELEVKWIGTPVDDFSSYQIAIMAEGSSDYTTLTGNDLEYYYDKNNKLLPYYTEETAQTITDTGKLYFHARIKQVEVELPGGLTTHQPLQSNVRYYIKVRTVKKDSADQTIISYSKYIGPVSSRTEFNQGDYDSTDREEKQKAIFLDKMQELEQGFYWRVAISNSTADRILLKGDRVVNALQSLSDSTFTVDLTPINVSMDRDEVYVPLSVVRTMNSRNKNLMIRTPGADYLLRPDTLDASANKQIKDLLSKTAVKDLYLRLIASRTDTASPALPSTGERATRIHDLEIQAVGSSRADSELRQLFHDKLYDKDTGLVGSKLSILQNTYLGTGSEADRLMAEYTGKLVAVIENELSAYIDTTIESVKLPSATQNITDFTSPVSASLSTGSQQGTRVPFVLYDGTAAWQKITENVQQTGRVTVNVLKTGKYTVLVLQGATKDIPDSYWAKDEIVKLTSKYDLGDVFSGIAASFMPDNRVSCREVILLYEKVIGRAAADSGLDIKQKSQKLGLEGIINPNGIMKNVRRQETAAVLLKLFAVKKGVSADSLRPGGNIYVNDDSDIQDNYYNSVLMVVDLGVMNTDSEGNFLPDGNMTRAEVTAAFVRLLELTGDL